MIGLMPIARTLAFLFLLLQNPDFGEKFLDDLQTLFGRLEVSELFRSHWQKRRVEERWISERQSQSRGMASREHRQRQE